ncbi:4-hydroxy-tetrahydrodipicolinate reductase [Spirochaetia bacterium 38H-sp]|uniref:4-hydroxy-tetrahydrodipicolinate reductase n=1 Tax=Rarispira pelagica TaxID=3141764 RepID=A0ABU9UCV7_9SPIR
MNVAIIGYGQMGKEVEKILVQRGHKVTVRIDPHTEADYPTLSAEMLSDTDAAIEFSHAVSVFDNAKIYAETKTPAVVGTTGWTDKIEEVKKIIANNTAYLWGSNFSIGAHIFFSIAAYTAKLIENFEEYDIMAYELHHKRKKDSPSGTALTLAEKILTNNTRKTTIVTDKLDRAPQPQELHVASVRGGEIPGTHTVICDSQADSIEITHRARNRSGFALGAVRAAEWLADKKGFFTVDDFISDILGGIR